MKNEKIKVAMVTNHFDITGIGTVMMNYCKALNKNKYSFFSEFITYSPFFIPNSLTSS